MYPEATFREGWDSEKRALMKSNILKLKKPWRMNWKSELSLDERLDLAFKRGVPVGSALRGVKQCPNCSVKWDRDLLAAKNLAFVFLFMVFNDLKRPFLFRRFKARSTSSLPLSLKRKR